MRACTLPMGPAQARAGVAHVKGAWARSRQRGASQTQPAAGRAPGQRAGERSSRFSYRRAALTAALDFVAERVEDDPAGEEARPRADLVQGGVRGAVLRHVEPEPASLGHDRVRRRPSRSRGLRITAHSGDDARFSGERTRTTLVLMAHARPRSIVRRGRGRAEAVAIVGPSADLPTLVSVHTSVTPGVSESARELVSLP
jgi:hypothetical protein